MRQDGWNHLDDWIDITEDQWRSLVFTPPLVSEMVKNKGGVKREKPPSGGQMVENKGGKRERGESARNSTDGLI